MGRKKNKLFLSISAKVKYRKPSKSLSNKPSNKLVFGSTVPTLARYSIQAAKPGLLTKNQLEAGRIVLKRRVKGFRGNVWVLVKPTRIVTKRALETRMGRGKGAPHIQLAPVAAGQLLYEVEGPPISTMRLVFAKLRPKISVPTVLTVAESGDGLF
jgi:large subunit ribosomal protein L16